jgi:hypothetical protein
MEHGAVERYKIAEVGDMLEYMCLQLTRTRGSTLSLSFQANHTGEFATRILSWCSLSLSYTRARYVCLRIKQEKLEQPDFSLVSVSLSQPSSISLQLNFETGGRGIRVEAHLEESAGLQCDAKLQGVEAVALAHLPPSPDVRSLAQRAVPCAGHITQNAVVVHSPVCCNLGCCSGAHQWEALHWHPHAVLRCAVLGTSRTILVEKN